MTDRPHTGHFDEALLELFLLAPGSIDPRARVEIERHLPSCGICSDTVAGMRAMHDVIGRMVAEEPTAEDRRTADRLARRGRGLVPAGGLRKIPDEALDGYAEVVEPTGRGLARRIAAYVSVNPLKSTAAVSFAGAMAALAFFMFRPAPDLNPVYAKFAREKLHVFNQRGDTLWTKLAPGMPERGSEHATHDGDKRVVMVEDIDGDGAGEVLVNGKNRETLFSAETLYCYAPNGEMKWKAGGGPIERLGDMEYMQIATWEIRSFFSMRLPGESAPRLFVMAQAVPYMTSKLSEISPADGHELNAYWHAGGLNLDVRCDVTGDSLPEIVIAAINNAFGCVSLIVLDPRNISGYGTTIPEYEPRGMKRADELYYVSLGTTDLARLVSSHAYNIVDALTATDRSTVQITTTESAGDPQMGGIIYSFGRGMRLLSAYPNDVFVRNRNLQLKEGRLSGPTDSAYVEKLKDGVMYRRGNQEADRGTARRQ